MSPRHPPGAEAPLLTLSDRPADAGSRRAALLVVVLSAGMFLALAPLARVPLARADWFIPLVQSTLIVNDLITAALLFGQLRFSRDSAVLVLAAGYVFAAVMAGIHLLTFPGVFSAGGLLGAGAQTTGYLHVFWHLGMPLAVVAYTALRRREHKLGPPVAAAVARALLVVALLAAALSLLATLGNDLLPPMLDGNRYSSFFNIGRHGQWAATALAMLFLWRRRTHSVLELWLLVMLCNSLFEIALVGIFNAGRWDVGFYSGRVYAMVASCTVLVMLLAEHGKIYRELAGARATARLELTLRESISAQMKSAQDTAEIEARFRALADGMSQLAWMARPDGWIYWYNRRWYEYTGTTLQEMEGWGWQSVHDPVARPAVVEQIRRSFETGEYFEMVFPLRGADGQYRPFLTRMMPLRDGEGRVLAWFGTNTDISQQHADEEALRIADRRKDEFIATLAHELRNPLAPIRTAVELIARAGPLPPSVARMARILDRQSRHLSRLVDDLLEISRITQGKLLLQRATVSLTECVHDAVHAARPALEAAGHHLEVHTAPEPLYADADATRITQAVVNLLNNASKFTPPGGRIAVSCWCVQGHARVRVCDNGIGIAPEHLRSIFGMFSQVSSARERSHGGLGIGLALVRGFVELHGGTVEAHSAGPGKGSEFDIRLPLLPLQAHAAEAARRPSPPAMMHRVLVVDDNEDAANSLAALLVHEGHEVRIAHGGEEALAIAFEFEPEAVLLDIGMPGMSGLEVARELRRRIGAGVRLIAVTGWGQAQDRELTREAGFDFHLTKPVDQAEVEALLAASVSPEAGRPQHIAAQRH